MIHLAMLGMQLASPLLYYCYKLEDHRFNKKSKFRDKVKKKIICQSLKKKIYLKIHTLLEVINYLYELS